MPEIDIPKKKKVGRPKGSKKAKATDKVMGVPNFAMNEKTVAKFLGRTKDYLNKYTAQGSHDAQVTKMKRCDEMFRLSAGQTKQNENKTRDDVDTIPGDFRRVVTIVTDNENDTYWHGERPPVEYVPKNNVDETQAKAANEICRQQNLLLEHSRDVDDRVDTFKDQRLFVNKYTEGVLGMEWLTKKHKIRERVPVTDDDGTVRSYKNETRTEDESHPHLVRYDLADCWFDAMIDDFRDQQCLPLRYKPTMYQIQMDKKHGHFINVDNISKKHLYNQESPAEERGDRHDNADDGDDMNDETGEFDGWNVWMRCPIDRTTGKWDAKNVEARWHIATFIGNIQDMADPVCVRLNPNPYADGDEDDEIPLILEHSHRDDKGAYHAGFKEVIDPKYHEIKTTSDQWFDAKNLQANAPYLVEYGALVNRDNKFGPRRKIVVQPGMMKSVERMQVEVNTNDMLAFLQWLKQDLRDDTFTQKPFMGEALGSRTSASEARHAIEQGMISYLEKVRYNGRTLVWEARWDAKMWRKFSDGDLVLALSRDGKTEEIRPGTLHGTLTYKLVAVDAFVEDVISRIEQDAFMSRTLPLAAGSLGPQRFNMLLGSIIKKRKIVPPEDHIKIFPAQTDTDAYHVAMSENNALLEGTWDEPKSGENHEIHGMVHKTDRDLYALMPDKDADILANIDAHILMHEQLREQENSALQQTGAQQAQANQQAPAGLPSAEAPVTTGGEAAQNLLGSTGGV